MANVAVIQGSSQGIGLALSRSILAQSRLHLVATSRSPAAARRAILQDINDGDAHSRLTTLELDVKHEGSIQHAAEQIKQRHGNNCLRLLINVSGILHAEKSITKIDAAGMLESFQINTFGHLLVYKHFVPLLPSAKVVAITAEDLADGLVKSNQSVLASMSARVGSIGDNRKGGWYSYRSSKAAVNQIIRTLNIELSMRSTPACAIALHPGTTYTNLSSNYISEAEADGRKEGAHKVDVAAKLLLDVIGQVDKDQGGRLLDYKGEHIPW